MKRKDLPSTGAGRYHSANPKNTRARMTKPKMAKKPTSPLPSRRYPEGTTPEQVAARLGFVPPHQRPEVIRRRKQMERETKTGE